MGALNFNILGRSEFALRQGFGCTKTLVTPDFRRKNFYK
jgi:hypothetical protein